jgi:hypothetical protein
MVRDVLTIVEQEDFVAGVRKGIIHVTINPYDTTPPSASQSALPDERNGKYITSQQAILNDIARNAVADLDADVETQRLNIEIDTMGNVIVKEHELAEDGMIITDKQKRIIRVPQEEAYQRIVEATQRKIDLLEHLYQESQREAARWFRRSFLSTAGEVIIITFSIFIPLVAHNLGVYYQSLPLSAILILTNLINLSLIIWIFRRSSIAHKQVDLYLFSLTEVRNFATITRFVAHIKMDDPQKQMLQKALVSRSLGLTEPHMHTPPISQHPPALRPSE